MTYGGCCLVAGVDHGVAAPKGVVDEGAERGRQRGAGRRSRPPADVAVDVAGPAEIGVRTVLVASPFRTGQNPDIEPDARINQLDELPALLEAWDQAIERNLP